MKEQVKVSYPMLKEYFKVAKDHNRVEAFAELCLDWAKQANSEIDRLTLDVDALQKFQHDAFLVYPNIDLDIEIYYEEEEENDKK